MNGMGEGTNQILFISNYAKICLTFKLKKKIIVSSRVGPSPSFSEGTPPFRVPPLSEANPNFRAIQIGACKLYDLVRYCL